MADPPLAGHAGAVRRGAALLVTAAVVPPLFGAALRTAELRGPGGLVTMLGFVVVGGLATAAFFSVMAEGRTPLSRIRRSGRR
jgi:hypothetical protein